jgi:hypothetical protein
MKNELEIIKHESKENIKKDNTVKYAVVSIAIILFILLLIVIFPIDKTDQQDCFRDFSTCSNKQQDVFVEKVYETSNMMN